MGARTLSSSPFQVICREAKINYRRINGRELVTSSGISAVKEAKVPFTASELGDWITPSVGALNAWTGLESGGKKLVAMNRLVTSKSVNPT